MIPVDSLEVFSIVGSYFYVVSTTFSCLNLQKRRDCGTAFGYHLLKIFYSCGLSHCLRMKPAGRDLW